MATNLATRLVSAIRLARADTAFGVPGGGPNLDVVEAMSDQAIRFILAHGETAACIMAATYGAITDRPAPVVVTRGPGAASAVNGAAQATLDRQSLVLITDTVSSASQERVPHQRLDQRAMLAPVTVGAITFGNNSTDADLANVVAEAVRWPRGTVHINYDADAGSIGTSNVVIRPETAELVANDAAMKAIEAKVRNATKPVVIVGVATLESSAEIRSALVSFGAPVLSTYQSTGVISSENDLHAGLFTNGASERPLLEQADLVIAVGLDMVEPIPSAWNYDAPVVSLALAATVDPYLPIAAEVVGDLATLSTRLLKGSNQWKQDAAARHRESVRSKLRGHISDTSNGTGRDGLGASESGLDPIDLVTMVAEHAPDPVTVCVDAGAHFLAVMPFWPVHDPARLFISNGLATMGYSVPAAIGAALARPGESVISFVGDGGLGMTLAELETIVRLDLPITVVVFNDATLSLIDIKQKPGFANRNVVGYTLTDFAATARSFGLDATVVETLDELRTALAGNWNRPRLLDARIDPSSYRHLIEVTRGD